MNLPTLASADKRLADFAELVGDRGPIAVAGGRTRWELGGALDPAATVIAAPTGIVEYQPEEMTVTVRCGTPVATLHTELAARAQRTALPERGGTVGGAIAVGENGLFALGRGLIRTAPLQVRYISADGRVVTSGGPTVKNVSGFDLPRLMVGSLGTLGLLAEVTLRTNPIPAVARWFSGRGFVTGVVRDALLAPSCVLTDGATTWVLLEGHAADVDAQARILTSLRTNEGSPFLEVEAAPDLPRHRWHLPPSTTAVASPRGSAKPRGLVEVVGLGVGFADEPQPIRDLDPAVTALNARIKSNFDPTGRLNPGRDATRK